MNMSFYELYIWLIESDFPSLSAIWTWLITVPWWLATGTVIVTVYAIRIIGSLTIYFLNWLFNWIADSGTWIGDKVYFVNGKIKTIRNLFRPAKKGSNH